eukprot:COSAG01_NODE_135_length_24448_cov_154.590086_9_plen_1053_part_00
MARRVRASAQSRPSLVFAVPARLPPAPMPKKGKKDDSEPVDRGLQLWDDVDLEKDVYGAALPTEEENSALLPQALAESVSGWLRPVDFGGDNADPACVLHVDPWPPAASAETRDADSEAPEKGAVPGEEPATVASAPSDSEEYSRSLQCGWSPGWKVCISGLAVPRRAALVASALAADPDGAADAEDADDQGKPPASSVDDDENELEEPAAPDATMSRIAECFLAIQNASTAVPAGSCLWEAVYPKNERGWPIVSETGMYAVKLWWDGAWRCVAVDDAVPVDVDGRSLMVHSVHAHELWPMLITKALLRAAVSRNAQPDSMADCAVVIHHLSGWSVESMPISSADISSLMLSSVAGQSWAIALQEAPLDNSVSAGVLCTAGVYDEHQLAEHALVKVPLLRPPTLLQVAAEAKLDDTDVGGEPDPEGADADIEDSGAEEAETESWTGLEPTKMPQTHEERPIPFSALATGFGLVYVCRPVADVEHRHTFRKDSNMGTESDECFTVHSMDGDEMVIQLTASLAALPIENDEGESEEATVHQPHCKLVVKTYDWAQPTCSIPVLTLETYQVVAGTVTVPRGLACYKLEVESACNCNVELISAAPLTYGEEATVLEEKMQVSTSIVEGESIGDAAGKIPLLLYGNIAAESDTELCLELRGQNNAVLPCTRFVITDHQGTAASGTETEYFCRRTALIKLGASTVPYSLAVLLPDGSDSMIALPWSLRTLSTGGAATLTILPPKFSDSIQRSCEPVAYYPRRILFREYVEVTKYETKADGLAYLSIRLGIPSLQSGMVRLEVFCGDQTAEESEELPARRVQGRKFCSISALTLAQDGCAKVLLQGSVTDAGAISTEMQWQLDICSTEKEMTISSDTAKAEHFASIRESWEADEKGRAERAEVARAAYLQPADTPGYTEPDESEEGAGPAAKEKHSVQASGPVVKTGSPSMLLSEVELAAWKSERAAIVAAQEARICERNAVRENQKGARTAQQEALVEQMNRHRSLYTEIAASALEERERYREMRLAQQKQQHRPSVPRMLSAQRFGRMNPQRRQNSM